MKRHPFCEKIISRVAPIRFTTTIDTRADSTCEPTAVATTAATTVVISNVLLVA